MMLFDKNQPPCAIILQQDGWFMQANWTLLQRSDDEGEVIILVWHLVLPARPGAP